MSQFTDTFVLTVFVLQVQFASPDELLRKSSAVKSRAVCIDAIGNNLLSVLASVGAKAQQ